MQYYNLTDKYAVLPHDKRVSRKKKTSCKNEYINQVDDSLVDSQDFSDVLFGSSNVFWL